MLTFVAPLVLYLFMYPMIVASLFRVELGLLFFITFVPIIALMQKIAQFPGGNNFADFLIVAMVIGSFLKSRDPADETPRHSSISPFVVLVICWSFVNFVVVTVPLDGSSLLVRLTTLKNYLLLPLIYFLVVHNLRDARYITWLLICVSLTMLAMDFNFYSTFRWMNTGHYSDYLRISGALSYLGPNEMGIFYSMYTFLLLGVSYYITDGRLKKLVLLVCACNFYPILFSYSRAAYSASLVGFISLGILKDRRLLAIPVLLVVLYSSILPQSVVERINSTFLNETDAAYAELSAVDVGGVALDTVGRKELWEKAMGYFEESPLFGIGFDTFRHREGMITHSLYFRLLAEQGILGLIVFFLFTFVSLKRSFVVFRRGKTELGRGIGLGFFVCIIVHLTGSLTGDQSLYYNLMAIYWFFLGIIAFLDIVPVAAYSPKEVFNE